MFEKAIDLALFKPLLTMTRPAAEPHGTNTITADLSISRPENYDEESAKSPTGSGAPELAETRELRFVATDMASLVHVLTWSHTERAFSSDIYR